MQMLTTLCVRSIFLPMLWLFRKGGKHVSSCIQLDQDERLRMRLAIQPKHPSAPSSFAPVLASRNAVEQLVEASYTGAMADALLNCPNCVFRVVSRHSLQCCGAAGGSQPDAGHRRCAPQAAPTAGRRWRQRRRQLARKDAGAIAGRFGGGNGRAGEKLCAITKHILPAMCVAAACIAYHHICIGR